MRSKISSTHRCASPDSLQLAKLERKELARRPGPKKKVIFSMEKYQRHSRKRVSPRPWSKGPRKMARGAAALPAGNGMLGVVWFRKIPFGFY